MCDGSGFNLWLIPWVDQGMECVEGALKSNFRPETTLKRTHQQVFLDNLWAANGQNGVSGEDFSVDDLLDLSKEGIEDGFLEAEAAEKEDIKPCSVSVSPYKQREKHMDEFYPTRRNVSVTHDLGSVPRTDLRVSVSLSLSLSLSIILVF